MKGQQAAFQNFYQENTWLAIGAYLAVYIVTTALSLPGAALLTLLGGALFGILVGTVLVSFASTIGATLAFLVSRSLLRDWVQNKFGGFLKTINEGIEKDGGAAAKSITMRGGLRSSNTRTDPGGNGLETRSDPPSAESVTTPMRQ